MEALELSAQLLTPYLHMFRNDASVVSVRFSDWEGVENDLTLDS